MAPIPPHIQTTLDAVGITADAESRWKRLEDWPPRRIRAHYFCECEEPAERVELAATRLGDRAVFVGQCPRCRVVYWRDGVSDR